ncbi:MAG: leucyl aminopeptidase, partial [Gemmatimonadetes bacterium]|nr:leucyl aminopeptidase [Gemmatimonadota bacterium]
MNITVRHGELQKAREEAIVVYLFEDAGALGGATAAVDKASGGQIRRVLDTGDFTGTIGQTIVLYPEDRRKITAQRIVLVGLGSRDTFCVETARRASAAVARRLQALGVPSAATIVHGAGAGDVEPEAAGQALAEAAIMATYRFEHYLSKPKSTPPLKRLTVIEADAKRLTAIRRGVKAGQQIAEAVCLSRDLCNHPGNTATPTYLAQTARSMARRVGLRCQILDEPAIRKQGMGALLGVAAGSAQPPRFIILEHQRPAGKKAASSKPLVFVGKGVTFDSGGISIKPSAKMGDMKFDMCGAAAVIGAMQAVATLGIKRHIVGIVPATENLLDGKAYKPGDVLKTMSGKTIEIDNTDAEG